MQWGQIKTIFIFCFLILDVYLLSQVLFTEDKYEELTDPEIASLEEEFEDRGINTENVPKEIVTATYLSATWHTFTNDELEPLKNQKFVNGGARVYGELKTPILLSENGTKEEIKKMLAPFVLYSDQYDFYRWDKEENILIFFQQFNKRPLYFNDGGVLMFFLNDKHEVTSYLQTLQEDIVEEPVEKELSEPLEIVDVLLSNNKIFDGDSITSMELGYHTFFPVAEGIQAFVPTWRIVVNEEKVFFVNAFDGQIIDIDEIDFKSDNKKHIQELNSKMESEKS